MAQNRKNNQPGSNTGEGAPTGADVYNPHANRATTAPPPRYDNLEAVDTSRVQFVDPNPKLREALRNGALSYLPKRDDAAWDPKRLGWENAEFKNPSSRKVFIPMEEYKTRGVSYAAGVIARVDYSGDKPVVTSATWFGGGGAAYDGIPRGALPGTSMNDLEAIANGRDAKRAAAMREALKNPIVTAIKMDSTIGLTGKPIWQHYENGKVQDGPRVGLFAPDLVGRGRDGFLGHGSRDGTGPASWRKPSFLPDGQGFFTAGCWTGSGAGWRAFVEGTAQSLGIKPDPNQSFSSLVNGINKKGGDPDPYVYIMHPNQFAESKFYLAAKNAADEKTRLASTAPAASPPPEHAASGAPAVASTAAAPRVSHIAHAVAAMPIVVPSAPPAAAPPIAAAKADEASKYAALTPPTPPEVRKVKTISITGHEQAHIETAKPAAPAAAVAAPAVAAVPTPPAASVQSRIASAVPAQAPLAAQEQTQGILPRVQPGVRAMEIAAYQMGITLPDDVAAQAKDFMQKIAGAGSDESLKDRFKSKVATIQTELNKNGANIATNGQWSIGTHKAYEAHLKAATPSTAAAPQPPARKPGAPSAAPAN